MQNIKSREEKMQKTIKNTLWTDFIKDICSRVPLVFHRNENQVSRYPESNRIGKLISNDVFMKNMDNNIGQKIFTSKSFFENFKELFLSVPLPTLSVFSSENSNYGDAIGNSKNSYLSFSLFETENVLYSYNAKYSINVINSVFVWDGSQNIYNSNGIIKSNNIFYSKNISNSSDIRFSSDLQGCNECIFCNDLSNQSYHIENKKYSKKEYFKLKKEYLTNKASFPQYQNKVKKNKSFLVKSTNTKDCHFCYHIKNGKNVIFGGSKDGYENLFSTFNGGGGTGIGNNTYGGVSNGGGSNNYNNILLGFGSNNYYCFYTIGCSFCLGCIGLKNKQFCILNKQYTKEERFTKANEIFAQMEIDGTLGKFFPASMNPFYFNDTAASLVDDSFTKEEVTADGFLWRDEEIKVDIPEGSQVIKTTELDNYQGFNNNGEREINPEILKKVILDSKGNVYRIVKMEYDFLVKYGLPLPEIHWLDRIKLGFKFK